MQSDLSTQDSLYRRTPIPIALHSEETGLPFSKCYDCESALANHENGYLIQKIVTGSETIMELALCVGCHDQLQSSYSKESREQIWNYYLDHADLPGRLKRFHALPPVPDFWLNNCITCKTLRGRLQEYAIAAHCVGEYLILGETPMMICSDCMCIIMESMSRESLETYDRWMDRVHPPTTDEEIEKPRKRVFF